MSNTANDDIRDEIRGLFVGERTLGDSFAPPLLFVAANAVSSLGVAATIAIAAGVLVAAWRIRNGQQIVYALAGIGAVGFAAFLALRSGRAESYFLPGIVAALGWAVAAFVSILVKRPLAGWSSWAFRRWPRDWYWRDDVRPAYSRVSWIWFWYFAIRGLGQAWMYAAEQPEILAVWKTVTSWPIILPLLYLSVRVGMARRDELGGPNIEEHLAGEQAPYVGGQRRF